MAPLHCPSRNMAVPRTAMSAVSRAGSKLFLIYIYADKCAVLHFWDMTSITTQVFALHPTEIKTIVKNYTTIPAKAGEHAPDYLISTNDTWNYALQPDTAKFDNAPSKDWTPEFAFDDSGEYPFSVTVDAKEVVGGQWGYWKGSKITNPPPASPITNRSALSSNSTTLRLVPFGSTNIRIAVFPYYGARPE